MAQIPNEAGLVTRSQIRGQNIPEVVTVDAQSPFQVLDVVRISDTQIQADIRYNGGSSVGDKRYVSVSSGEVSFKLQDALEVAPAQPFILTIDAINPTSIVADGNGFPCTISGTGFSEGCVVSISGSGVTFNLVSATDTTLTGTFTASIGAAQTIRNVTVTREGQSVTLNSALTILPVPVALTVTGITPNTLPQNTTRNYTITGTGFVSGAAVTISGTGVTVNSTSFENVTELRANITVSAGATVGARNVTVTNPNSASSTLNSGASVTVDTTIYIDEAWLTANGPAPYFLGTEGATYVLETDVTTPGTAFYIAKRNITFDLNGHTIFYNSAGGNDKWGICLYLDWHNTEISPAYPQAQEPTGFTYRNGIVECAQAGDRCYGVYGHRGQGSLCHDMEVISKGRDSWAIFFRWENATIRHSFIDCQSSSTFDRHQSPACVKVGGSLTARYNITKGGNSSFVSGAGSVIEHNICRHSGFVTNGYGGFFYRTQNVRFSNNIVIPSNGRGIIHDGGLNHTFENNIILHLEQPNLEFGTRLNPPAVRSRFENSNVVYRYNTSLGIAGSSAGLTSASSIYLSNQDNPPVPNEYTNNNCTTILIGPVGVHSYCQPLTLENQGSKFNVVQKSQDIIDNNVFRSNHTMIRTGGVDGYSFQQRPMIGNEFQFVDGNEARLSFIQSLENKLQSFEAEFLPHRFIQAQAIVDEAIAQINSLITNVPLQSERQFWWTFFATDTFDQLPIFATITDSIFGLGVDPETINHTALRNMSQSLRVGFQHNYQLLDGSTPVANASITLVNDGNDEFVLQSNENGFVSVPIIEYGMDKPIGVNIPFSKNARTVSTLTVEGYDPWILTHSEI